MSVLGTINLRRLAAIDIALLGYKLIFAEYLLGVVLSIGLGLFVIFRSHSHWETVLLCHKMQKVQPEALYNC
jgi:hypothetical protein